MEELRAFTRMLFLKYRLRGSAERLGLRREAVRKFVLGETLKPHEATRKKMAEAYLRYHETRGVAERLAPVEAPDPAEMKLVFRDRDDAYRLFNLMHELFRAHATGDDEALSKAEAVRSILRRMADAGFATEFPTYEELRADAQRKKPGAAAAPPPRKASPEAAADPPAPPKKRRRKPRPENEDGG